MTDAPDHPEAVAGRPEVARMAEPGSSSAALRPPTQASTAENLEAIRSAVVDAAGVSGGLWISYLFVLFYLLVAAGGVTHRDLFFANPVKLPFLGIDLPLKGFFWLGPALFIIVHAYVLLHFALLASKATQFDAQLRAQIDDADARTRVRRQLPINIFVQFLAGPREVRQGATGFLLRLIAWISLVVGPVALLVFLELQFLPYHDVWISWWQRIAVCIDLLLLWMLWPAILHGEAGRRSGRRTWRGTGWLLACMSLVSVLLVFAIANFRGEWLEAKLSWFPLRQTLVAGGVDEIARRPASLWSNRLVLPDLEATRQPQLDSEAKIVVAPEMTSLRGRHLENAVLIGAILRKVDFLGANLQGANLSYASLQGVSLDDARLQGANLYGANLRGASLNRAQLQDASLVGAQLQGASLEDAQLQSVQLDFTNLQGASLNRAHLQGATFGQLQGAALDGAQLQGASFYGADLRGATIRSAIVWRADVRFANVDGARIEKVETGWIEACRNLPGNPPQFVGPPMACRRIDALDTVRGLFDEDPDRGRRGKVVADLQRTLDPTKPLKGEDEMAKRWIELQARPLAPDLYEKGLARQWREMGCAADGAPFLLASLTGAISHRFDIDSVQVPLLATDFLSEECAGARGISEGTKARLIELRARAPASQKPPKLSVLSRFGTLPLQRKSSYPRFEVSLGVGRGTDRGSPAPPWLTVDAPAW
jgi:uncharacterized protein YjbI with pentapeptide repeats